MVGTEALSPSARLPESLACAKDLALTDGSTLLRAV